ncbi:MAG: IS3 family transposase [Thermodesulfovibrionales bacterium]|nr:IS3 family transposase [Thermodesulfovibrionales bacterium]
MQESKGHRKFDQQFKEEAVRLVTEGGRSVTEVAHGLGIHENLLHTWKRKHKEDPAGSFPGKGHLKPQDEEFKRLQKENANLKEDREILKKAFGHLLKTPQMKYWFMDQHRSWHGVQRMCRVIGASRSGYYGWRRQPQSKRHKDNEKILMEIKESHKNSRRAYGSPRITKDIQARGTKCSENRVARLMKVHGIIAKTKKKFKATTNSKHNLPVAPNLLNQNFVAEKPNTVWVSDITYIATLEGWLYLAVILDLYSRQVVGWAMSDRLTADFVVKALYQAIGRRRSASGCILHSDRGVQYASSDFREVLKAYGFIQSMSRKGNCYDNAVAESFFHTLKTEHVYDYRYETRTEAIQSVFEYIEMFYNRQRRHSALGYRSPVSFELEAMAA